MKTTPLARNADLVTQPFGDELLVYDLRRNRAVCLNKAAAIIWEHCDGRCSIQDIRRQICRTLRARITEDFVILALLQLDREDLIDDGFEHDPAFAEVSRREVIKKMGVASMVALPIVSAISAPAAANAQSAAAQTCVINACIQAGNEICTGTCVGMQVANLRYSSTDGSCTNQIGSATGQCNSRVDTGDIRITNIF